jgi:hypothetical protein
MPSIVDFYRGTHADFRGRKLADICKWDDEHLEGVHNYIQILFPNRDPSPVNPAAPVLDDATVAAFARDETLRRNLAGSLDVMLRFYGLEYDAKSGQVRRRPEFAEQSRNWLSRHNHNYLRITRILKCLMALGLPERARAFFRCLEAIYAEHSAVIGAETFAYWRAAVREQG